MTGIAERLKAEILKLAAEDRAELAYCLICSLDGGDDCDAQSVSEVELGRRLQEMESGTVTGVSAEDVFAAMRKKYP
jgi:putative addiction module component (TIGR02574 family)